RGPPRRPGSMGGSMSAAYCPATLTSMRHMARHGANVEELARRLGWHPSTVDRVCARHGIEIAGGDPDADLRPPLVSEPRFHDGLPQPQRRERAGRPRKPTNEVRADTIGGVCVTPIVSAAVRAEAKRRNVSVSRLCGDILEAAVERGL
ncbi:MAG: hypothetical protein J0H17_18670, partial [Rhizobiales bacterium]|nr:hypothetical protein [Hyphomicrobiales bacterium]